MPNLAEKQLEDLERIIDVDTSGGKPGLVKYLQSRNSADFEKSGGLHSPNVVFKLLDTCERSSVGYKWAVVDIVAQYLGRFDHGHDFELSRTAIWRKLMSFTMWADFTDLDPHLLKTLLSLAFNCDTPDAWKSIALLLKIAGDRKDRCSPILASLVQAKYRAEIGRTLEQTQNFQLAVHLIKFLAFLFPKATVCSPESGPQIWEDLRQNNAFFGDLDYPSKCLGGEMAFCAFALKKLGPFPNFGTVRSFTYTNEGAKTKRRTRSDIKYLQHIHGIINLWQTGAEFYEIEVKNLAITTTLTTGLHLKLLGTPATVISASNAKLLKAWRSASTFLVDFDDDALSEKIAKSCHRYKVSEVTSYIPLNFNISSADDSGASQSYGSLALPTPRKETSSVIEPPSKIEPLSGNVAEKIASASSVIVASKVVALPEPSKLNGISKQRIPNGHLLLKPPNLVFPKSRIQKGKPKVNANKSDEWDFDRSSRSCQIDNTQNSSSILASTSNVVADIDEFTEAEQSPLVMVLKRKQARAITKGANNLTKKLTAFAAPTVSKIDSQCTAAEKLTDAFVQPVKHQKPKPKPINSVSKEDILQLDSIFSSLGPQTHSKQHNRAEKVPVLGSPGDASERPRIPKSEKKRKLDKNIDDDKRMTRSRPQLEEMPVVTKPLEPENGRMRQEPNKNKEVARDEAPPKSAVAVAESTNLDSTTLVTPMANAKPSINMDLLGPSFTNQLQEQIFNSISTFSDGLTRKMNILNEELNHKICSELSQKYQKMFDHLQDSFHHDVSQMSQFMLDVKDLLHLPEDQLVKTIREKQLN
ncbi:LANO_0A05974g1_1 [Lachancea nothofagi CBS 11611]|uniref:LANO_0A05974g1_1 n=1 Tax=Lachancea nothofagi CBS 11611 TaxID=1266666 RepID=A0A1G4IRE5_9SACH|nr:LANO_0A05974g1_1 [Lachancea nothofagi CBS 11611]